MKKIWIPTMLIGGLFLNYGCSESNKKEETIEVAEQKNDSIMEANNTPDKMEDAAEFVVNAFNGSMMEIEAGKLAHKNAKDKEVMKFAHQVVEDHSKATEELKTLATKKNIVLPEALDADSKNMIDKLRDKKGKEFDEAYIDMMVEDHKKDINKFENASNEIEDPEIKAWVDKTMATLKMHKNMGMKTDSLLEAKEDKMSSGGTKDKNLK